MDESAGVENDSSVNTQTESDMFFRCLHTHGSPMCTERHREHESTYDKITLFNL